jgi:hypothetical protein
MTLETYLGFVVLSFLFPLGALAFGALLAFGFALWDGRKK